MSMDETLRLQLKQIREIALGLELDASTYDMELFSRVDTAYGKACWEFGILASRLEYVLKRAPWLRSDLPAEASILELWKRQSACPDLMDPRLIWFVSSHDVARLMSEIDNILTSLES